MANMAGAKRYSRPSLPNIRLGQHHHNSRQPCLSGREIAAVNQAIEHLNEAKRSTDEMRTNLKIGNAFRVVRDLLRERTNTND